MLLRDRLGTSDCTGNLPFKKDQTKTKPVQTRIFGIYRRQIGNTVLGGCNRRPLEKNTAFKVLPVWCSTKQGKLFL